MNNIEPRTRNEREGLRNKEAIEKARINQRIGFETRNVDMKSLLHNPDPKSTLFCPENSRFDKDFAVHDRNIRSDTVLKKDLVTEKHRLDALERETLKWTRMENEYEKDRMKMEKKRQVFTEAKRNSNSVGYSPISLDYHNDKHGEALRVADEKSRIRNQVRAKNLDLRANCGYNILTGEDRKVMNVPSEYIEKYADQIVIPQHRKGNIF